MAERTIHPAIIDHLAGNHLCAAEGSSAFLFPELSELPSPFLLKAIDQAAAIVIDSIRNRDDILIWGDYDVDGITGTSLLCSFFRELGITVHCHIPNRLSEGYGLNSATLRSFSEKLKHNKLLITVDCGIANAEEILLARRYGFRTIVTDHHQVPEAPLHGDATVNPKRGDCGFPSADLAGVGVAFYLAAAIRSRIKENNSISVNKEINLKSFLGHVAIGTIADIMPLTGVNRVLVKGGFEAIATTSHPGIAALFQALDIDPRRFTAEAVSFRVAPAINAAGRLGEAGEPLGLLLCQDEGEAREYASRLIKINNRRREITEHNMEKAVVIAHKEIGSGHESLVILGDFHEGVLGIVASRLVEEFRVPSLVCCYKSMDRTVIKGSGRAPRGRDLYSLLDGSKHHLANFGGHALAAGFSLKADNFLDFKEQFELLNSLNKENKSNDSDIVRQYFCNLSISDALDSTLLDNLLALEPTGEGNPRPIFVDRGVRFVGWSSFGKNRAHIRGMVRGRFSNVQVTGFRLATKMADIDPGQKVCATYTHRLEYFNGKSSWHIHLVDVSQ